MVFGYRPAPIQVTYMGYDATTGLKEIDYFLADEQLIPKGSEHLFSEEYVKESILQNGRRLPLFTAWSCSVGPFALKQNNSLAELMVKLEGGGAIASFAASSPTYPVPSGRLADEIHHSLLAGGRPGPPLGLAIMGAKAISGASQGSNKLNDEKYNLLGDPALLLALPRLSVRVDDVDSLTLKRGTVAFLSGAVADSSGLEATWFDGTATVAVYGMADTSGYTYLDTLCPWNPGWKHEPYTLMGNPLFKGDVDVTGGRFEASFFVPIGAHIGDLGRVSAYVVSSDSSVDGAGGYDSVEVVLESPDAPFDDHAGPTATISIDGEMIHDDLWFTPESVFRVELEDESGIYTMGNDFFFSINISVDRGNQIDLDDRFAYKRGSFREGELEFRWSELSKAPTAEGEYTISFRASDNLNNRSEVEYRIRLSSELDPLDFRTDILNYPNPFNPSKRETRFFVDLTRDAWVTIQIFTSTGKLIREFRDCRASGPTILDDCRWDGTDEDGDPAANGVYLIRAFAENHDRSGRVESIGKAVILRDVKRKFTW